MELPEDYLRTVLPDMGCRRNTGLKYHRITGSPDKQIYNRAWAMAAADHHAGDFLNARIRQFEHLQSILPIDPVILSPFDAELFGHWWYEGPEFLDLFLRKAAYDQNTFRLTTPGAYLKENPTQQMVSPSPSSWGNKGYWEVWLDRCNAWIYPHLHSAARRMTAAARAVRACIAASISCQAVRAMERKIKIKKPASSAIRMDCIWPKGARAQVSLGKCAARRSSG
jgi:1,4-alpha-glucan branching enzyme